MYSVYYRDWGAEKLAQAQAAGRAIHRQLCCRSQFKFKCYSCGENINRGDKITQTHDTSDGMTLRFRGGDATDGLTADQTCFYQPSTGSKRWVCVGCQPCFWYRSENHRHELASRLLGVWTEWGAKLEAEYQDWYVQTGGDLPGFINVMGYPQEKYMSDRIVNAVTKFQALWRGYIYKMALPYALEQRKKRGAEEGAGSRLYFQVGDEGEILFDEGSPEQMVDRFRVVRSWMCSQGGGVNYVVYFRSDDTYLNFTRHRLMVLTRWCEAYKRRTSNLE